MSGHPHRAPQSQTEQEQIDPTRDPVENPRVPTDMGQVESRAAAGITDVAAATAPPSSPENLSPSKRRKQSVTYRPGVRLMADAMEGQLLANDDAKKGWAVDNPQLLASKAKDKLFALNNMAVSYNSGGTGKNVDAAVALQLGADVCNYVMMVVDLLGGFDEPTGRS